MPTIREALRHPIETVRTAPVASSFAIASLGISALCTEITLRVAAESNDTQSQIFSYLLGEALCCDVLAKQPGNVARLAKEN